MDPDTAAPRLTAMRSLTVVADSVMQADAATTALFGMGEGEIARELARNLPGARLARIV
jgi:thiamine biosynthesis lipoprotein ApbE